MGMVHLGTGGIALLQAQYYVSNYYIGLILIPNMLYKKNEHITLPPYFLKCDL